MTEANSIGKSVRIKPPKPYEGFPLRPHAMGYWCKTIRQKLHYFGRWDDGSPDNGAQAALDRYNAERAALEAGKEPGPDPEALVVRDVADAFLFHKKDLMESGELTLRTWLSYKAGSDAMVDGLGKKRLVADLRPDDFAKLRNKMAKTCGPVRLGNLIQSVRSVFKHAYENGMIDKPVRFGSSFKKPSKKTLRLHKAGQERKLFSAEEVRRIIDAARQPLKAMFHLAVNCGFGNADVGRLPMASLDLEGGWVNYHREKTGIDRRIPLWPETVAAIREWLAKRPTPKDSKAKGLAFVTQKQKGCWFKETMDNPLSRETRKLLDSLGLNGHRNFYTLRHTFRTVADASKDQPACDHIMGHESPHMSSVYREGIDDERLKAVTDHVRRWLFGEGEQS